MLAGGAALGLLGAGLFAWNTRKARMAAATAPPGPPPVRPPRVPLSSFTAATTAEEATAGLDLSGRTVLVTGVTSGIGFETMRVLALRGAHVVGTGRKLQRAQEACASVAGRASALELELSDCESVVRCAASVQALAPSLDVVVCNAGVMALQRLERVAGVEKQFATNHLGHFLLVRRLLGMLQAAPQGRVVVVSSDALGWAHPAGIEWDNLSGERDYDPDRAYGQSKLANALFALELSRRLAGSAVTANALHPGYVATKLFRHYPWSLRGYRNVLPDPWKATVDRGAATQCYVATAPALATVTGQFFKECNPIVADPRARDEAAAARLWEASERLVAPYLGIA